MKSITSSEERELNMNSVKNQDNALLLFQQLQLSSRLSSYNFYIN